MALIQCPECKTEISDKAGSCPKCGHPMNEEKLGVSKNKAGIFRTIITGLILLGIVFVGLNVIQKTSKSSQKPPMPIEVKFRKALLADGYVVGFKNTSNRQLTVVANFTNPTLKTSKQFALNLSPGSEKEFGHMEGWNFVSGDTIAINHNDYATWTGTIP